MTSEEYIKLYEKYQLGRCSSEEVRLLMDHFSQFRMDDADLADTAEDIRIKNEVYRRIKHTAGIKKRSINMPQYWWSAAAVFLLICGALLIFRKQPPLKTRDEQPLIASVPIKPASTVATLTLADGSVIELGQAANGVLSNQGAVNVRKQKSGELVYESRDEPSETAIPAKNTLTIPRGGHYQIVLNDGTRVWLNAASSLTFPTVFTGSERRVQLVGEAYFEVAENKKMPFRVVSDETQVEVLGTHFNFRAYPEDELVKTTLLEGAIRLSTPSAAVLLKPGEQGSNRSNGMIDVRSVKSRESIAWKNGLFIFRNERITEIMKQISRWYNVDVVYQTNVSDQSFGGVYSKNKDLSELLKGLELTGLVHFKIEGRRIIVMN
jgi:ferric-dicitrate binding protein FerR (iron transport regulator)